MVDCYVNFMLRVNVYRIAFDVIFNTKSHFRIGCAKASTKTNFLILCMVCDHATCYAICDVK